MTNEDRAAAGDRGMGWLREPFGGEDSFCQFEEAAHLTPELLNAFELELAERKRPTPDLLGTICTKLVECGVFNGTGGHDCDALTKCGTYTTREQLQ